MKLWEVWEVQTREGGQTVWDVTVMVPGRGVRHTFLRCSPTTIADTDTLLPVRRSPSLSAFYKDYRLKFARDRWGNIQKFPSLVEAATGMEQGQ